jgi:hypothetical protein
MLSFLSPFFISMPEKTSKPRAKKATSLSKKAMEEMSK